MTHKALLKPNFQAHKSKISLGYPPLPTAPWLLQMRLWPKTVYRFTYWLPPTAELRRPDL